MNERLQQVLAMHRALLIAIGALFVCVGAVGIVTFLAWNDASANRQILTNIKHCEAP